VYFRSKLNQWNCSLGMVGRALGVGVFLCDDLYMSSGSCTGKTKFSVDCWEVLKAVDWMYIIDTRGRIGESDVWWDLRDRHIHSQSDIW